MRFEIGIAALLPVAFFCVTFASAQSTHNVDAAVTHESSVLSSADAAARWGLTVEEYEQYETAMAGLRGRLSDPHITPIEVLGIEAKTEAQRRKYAERWVKVIEADTAKVLAFSNAVNDAWARLRPDSPMIDRSRINRLRARGGSKYQPIPKSIDSLMLNGRLLVFTREHCAPCDTQVKSLIARAASGEFKGLDLYLLDVPSNDQSRIQGWARGLGVPANAVRDRKITLNFDAGAFERLTTSLGFSPGVYPAVFHHKGADQYDYVRVK